MVQALGLSCLAMIATASGFAATTRTTTPANANPSITSTNPRDCPWWNGSCDQIIDDLDARGGERYVSSHDAEGSNTKNWLHVTNSSPQRRVQYEIRYCSNEATMAGIIRFGDDCEGPPGLVHGGAMASVADAASATAVYYAAGERWGFTTNLNCNYRTMLPLGTPVHIEAKVVALKKRRASIEWAISSLTETDKKGEPVKHSFGTADFLLPKP